LQILKCHGLCLFRSNFTLAELGLVDGGHPLAAQRLHLSPASLRATSEDNFWSMMLHMYNKTQARARVLKAEC
jgi:hypothetical protein